MKRETTTSRSSARLRLLLACPAVLFAAGTVAGTVHAQSQDCANATVIEEGKHKGTTSGGTRDGEATCGKSETSPDVWYSFVAERDCNLTVSTCGSSFDTALSVHAGCPGTRENQLACNDDLCGLQSELSVNVTGGETYMIRLSGYDGEAGDFVLDLECSGGPPSDLCVDASPIGLGVHTGSTSQMGSDGAASCGASASSPDAWFSYTPTQDCLILASTCGVGTGFDSVLSVHSG
ncbi:MAG: hypothetical protein O7J95_21275, partial [Planctomycetota bacterium]|nr:hypothetical protein [Planctomycetota bacterium]